MKNKTPQFIGRRFELGQLAEEYQKDRPSLTLLYGRRRIGKTRLLKEFCQGKKHLRFEGLEEGSREDQINHFLAQLARQTGQKILAQLKINSWQEVFELMTSQIPAKRQVIVFDEFPWMIQKDSKEVSLFKYHWDNFWSQKKKWMIIICGSANTFMVKDLILSAALYGRIHHEILLEPLLIHEVHQFFGQKKSAKEIVDLYLVFGGIPRYLEEINPRESVIQNIQKLCFIKNSFFVREFDRLFHDEFKKTEIYAKISCLLAKKGNLNYTEIVQGLGVDVGGGYQSYLQNLERARFIESYIPFHLKENTRLVRYRVVDEYLLFYFYYIQPNLSFIQQNTKKNFFLHSIGKNSWSAWTGFAFERFCLKHIQRIEELLNINQLVKNVGSLFNRKTTSSNGFQIDLLFARHDNVITLCEIKYTSKPIGPDIIPAVEKKASLLKLGKKQSIERVLITASPPTKALTDQNYFNQIIPIEDFLSDVQS